MGSPGESVVAPVHSLSQPPITGAWILAACNTLRHDARGRSLVNAPHRTPAPSSGPAPDHPWLFIAPTPQASAAKLPHPLRLAGGVTFGALPAWVAEHDFTTYLTRQSREKIKRNPVGFVVPYAAAALGDPHPKHLSPPRSWQDVVEDSVQLAALACWLDAPRSFDIECFAHFEQPDSTSAWIFRHAQHNPGSLFVMQGEAEQALTLSDAVPVLELHRALLALKAGGTVLAAVHSLIAALGLVGWQVRYLLDWVSVEALFGPEDGREITYRMAQRVALFLGQDRRSAVQLNKEMKLGYGWRSKVVHGLRLKKLSADQSRQLSCTVESVLRRALVKILGDGHAERFDGSSREAFLDGLTFDLLPASPED